MRTKKIGKTISDFVKPRPTVEAKSIRAAPELWEQATKLARSRAWSVNELVIAALKKVLDETKE